MPGLSVNIFKPLLTIVMQPNKSLLTKSFGFLKPPLILIFTLNVAAAFPAESNPQDSVDTITLDEVNVTAARVIRKADMDIYHPSENAVENSSNGLQLLALVNIPSLVVDQVMEKVSSNGENVQIRINGRIATVQQVKELTPESIRKVEWIDNPGLRYNNASYVLNLIVTNPDTGGDLMLMAQPMLNAWFGNYNGNLNLNHGKSQWSLSLYYKPTISNKIHREYHETFTYPDGATLTRNETPIGGRIVNTFGSGALSYSYTKPDTTIFYAQISTWNDYDNLARYNGKISLSDESQDLNLTNESGNKGYTPKLSLYWEQHFTRNSTLVVDFSASVFSGHSFTNYLESFPESSDLITDIHTYIKDFNQAYALEADYIKNWNMSKFTTGFNYSANRNRSKYRNLDNAVFHQNQDKFYAFGEYFQRLGKFTFTGGIGVQYNTFKFMETGEGSKSWNFRPQATLTFSPNHSNLLRLNFTSSQATPSLEETNIVPQQTDGFQWVVGNPNLKTYTTYKLDFRYAFNFWRITGNFNIAASTSPNCIAPFLFWQDNRLISSYENSNGKQSLAFSLAPQVQIIPGWLMLSGRIEYLNEKTRGSDYKLYNHNWNGNMQLVATHWNFTLMAVYERARRTLWGEKLSWGEDMSAIVLAYKWKGWQFGTSIFMPFSKYDQGSKMLSKWNKNEYHLRLDFRMVGLIVSYNLQWGRQKEKVNKLIDSDAAVDKSAAKSR